VDNSINHLTLADELAAACVSLLFAEYIAVLFVLLMRVQSEICEFCHHYGSVMDPCMQIT